MRANVFFCFDPDDHVTEIQRYNSIMVRVFLKKESVALNEVSDRRPQTLESRLTLTRGY